MDADLDDDYHRWIARCDALRVWLEVVETCSVLGTRPPPMPQGASLYSRVSTCDIPANAFDGLVPADGTDFFDELDALHRLE